MHSQLRNSHEGGQAEAMLGDEPFPNDGPEDGAEDGAVAGVDCVNDDMDVGQHGAAVDDVTGSHLQNDGPPERPTSKKVDDGWVPA